MKDVSDVLTVSFDSGLKDEPALCVSRRCGEKIVVLKMELGEQADILYHLLTEQMTKAEIDNRLEDLSKRVETLEKQMEEDREKQLKKLQADLDYAKFRCGLPPTIQRMIEGEEI